MLRSRIIALIATLVLPSCSETPGEPTANQPQVTEGSTSGADQFDHATPQPDQRASRFTKLTDTNCKLTDEIEETGDWVRSCPGVDGYGLQWSSGDLREDLGVTINGYAVGLELPGLVTNGAFDWLGETVEWRGSEGQPPDVLIMRVHLVRQDGKSDSGSIAIARLGRAPCVVAVVKPGAGQSERARSIADGKLPACLKP